MKTKKFEGFTLIELLLVMVLGSVVLATCFTIDLWRFKFFSSSLLLELVLNGGHQHRLVEETRSRPSDLC